jgi:hypothetical protein
MIKNQPPKALLFYSELIREFWINEEINFESWHTTLLMTIFHGKENPQDPNSHRGICLKETSQKNPEHHHCPAPNQQVENMWFQQPIWPHWIPRSSPYIKKSTTTKKTTWP